MKELIDFIGNHVFASIVGTFGVISYGLGIAEQAQAITTRFKAWQLQALGAGFFFISVVMVLVSYDQERRVEPAVVQASPAKVQNAATSDPDVLPGKIASEYVALMSRAHTSLQEQRFLKAYVGKHMDVSLELASLERRGEVLRGQFRAGRNADVFVEFSPDWEDYLLSKNVGDTISFRVKILGDEASGYGLGEASPL